MSVTPVIEVLDDPAERAANWLVAAAETGQHIALTGGTTPRSAYERAAAAGGDWRAATLWFGDERCVPPDDDRSNYGMARDALIERLPEPRPAVHRIKGELGPDAGAADYEATLHEVFGAGLPTLDLILLGLGPDGHCASLFGGKPAVEERERMVVGVHEAGLEPFVPRVSFTLPLINAAREVVFLVSGENKADAAARAFAGSPDPAVPASLVRPASGALTVLLDPAAASKLPEEARG